MPYFYVLRKIETHRMQKSIESRTFGKSAAFFRVPLSICPGIRRVAFGCTALILALFVVMESMAQEDLFLVFGSVKLEDANKRLPGVDVIVYQDGVLFDQLTTSAKGDYDFELPLRHLYTFSFVLDGHSNKQIEVDASGIPEGVIGNRNMDLDMSMLPLPNGFDASIFEDAYGRGEYDPDKNTVVFDNNYTVRMRNRVNAEFARLERLDSESERMRENFDDFVRKGDRSGAAKEWQKAIDFYESALSLFPDEQEVIAKRDQAQSGLDAANASNASAAAFQSLLDEGDQALSRDDLEKARDAFSEAKELQPDAREPREGLRRVDEREEAMQAESESNAEYLEIIEDADKYFEREQYDRAINLYSEASVLKPGERYPQNQIDEAETRKSDLASQAADIVERTIQYEALIDEANQMFRDDDYENALAKYEEAGLLLPAERFWQQRAEASRERLEEMLSDQAARAARELAAAERAAASAELKEKRRKYDAINDEADVLFRNDDYESAIVIYEKALAVLPDERYPQQRINEAQQRINEAAGIDESDDKESEDGTSVAENKNDRKKRIDRDEEESREGAAAAQTDDSDAEIDSERSARQAAEANARAAAEATEDEYDALIAEADNAFDASNWTESRRRYDAALRVKPNDRYAKSRLSRIDKAEAGETAITEDGNDFEERAAVREAQRLREEQEFESAEEMERAAQDAERQRRLDETAALEKEREKQRQEQAGLDRKRAEQMMANLNASEEDEVETYFSEALRSEAIARKAKVEEAKRSQAELISESAANAVDRRATRQRQNEDLDRLAQSNAQTAVRNQEQRIASFVEQQEEYRQKENAAQIRSNRLIENGEDAVANEKASQTRMQSDRGRDYTLNVPDLDSKKRTWRNLFRGIKRSAEEKRSVSSENIASTSKRYREIGRGANERSQERWFASRRQAKKVDRALSKRERESQQRAYDKRKDEKERLDKMAVKSPQDYQLAEGDEDVLQGVSEESYDIPNGLVIERTVRDGNKVTRYRKVVTKTGTYYFKADHSITSVTWKRETSMVLD